MCKENPPVKTTKNFLSFSFFLGLYRARDMPADTLTVCQVVNRFDIIIIYHFFKDILTTFLVVLVYISCKLTH